MSGKGGVLGKHPHNDAGKRFRGQASRACHRRTRQHADPQRRPDPPGPPRAEIVSQHRLQPLRQPHDDHHKEKKDAVDDPERADSLVAAVPLQGNIDNAHHGAGAQVHQAGRKANGRHGANGLPAQPPESARKMQRGGRIAKMPQHPDKAHGLRAQRRQRGPHHPPAQHLDENGRKHGVAGHRQHKSRHSLVGIAARPHDMRQVEQAVANGQRQKKNTHEIAGGPDSPPAGAKKFQGGIQRRHAHAAEDRSGNNIQEGNITENPPRSVHISGSHADGADGSPADTQQHTEGKSHVHQGKGHAKRRQGLRADPSADKNAVHNIVQRDGDHARDGRQRIAKQQPGNGRRPQGGGSSGGRRRRVRRVFHGFSLEQGVFKGRKISFYFYKDKFIIYRQN